MENNIKEIAGNYCHLSYDRKAVNFILLGFKYVSGNFIVHNSQKITA